MHNDEVKMFKTISKDGINITRRDNTKIIEIDPDKARYRDMRVSSLGAFGRRKFENLVFLANTEERLPIKICYKP